MLQPCAAQPPPPQSQGTQSMLPHLLLPEPETVRFLRLIPSKRIKSSSERLVREAVLSQRLDLRRITAQHAQQSPDALVRRVSLCNDRLVRLSQWPPLPFHLKCGVTLRMFIIMCYERLGRSIYIIATCVKKRRSRTPRPRRCRWACMDRTVLFFPHGTY